MSESKEVQFDETQEPRSVQLARQIHQEILNDFRNRKYVRQNAPCAGLNLDVHDCGQHLFCNQCW